ncbi:hypothetical protein [Methylomonas sp. MgM2]
MRDKQKKLMLQLLLVALMQATAISSQAALDNKGTDFILQWLRNYQTNGNYEVHLTADVTTDVTIEYPVNSPTFSQTITVTPGTVKIVSLPSQVADGWTANTIQNNNVHLFADKEFVAYVINRLSVSSDAGLGLPVDTFNTEYIVSNWDSNFGYGEFGVYAAYDNTQVTITPTKNLVGRSAGIPFTVTLNRGEGYLARAAAQGNASNLTGTLIQADRPIGMLNGDECTQVPYGTTYCDHTFEISQPVQSWGKSVLITNLPNRQTTFYQVVASEDDTTVNKNGALLTTLDKGQYFSFSSSTDDLIEADKPIFVTQFMTGISYPGSISGDPAMGNMVPFAQYQNSYTFSTVGGSQFAQNFLSIIVPDSQIGIATLDGSVIPASSFSSISSSAYSVARLPLTDGVHSTSSNEGHGITVEGYNSYDSYIYPGGALFDFINPAGDANPPICSVQNNAGTPPSASGTVTDNRPSEDVNNNDILDPGEDLNGNGQIDTDTGVFFVELDPGATNLTLTVAPFTPGDGEATFGIGLTDPSLSGSGVLVGKDGAGNVCRETVNLNVSQASCDTDTDGDVDINDLAVIKSAVRTSNPLYDIDGDGIVSYNDLRKCTVQCTNARCAP